MLVPAVGRAKQRVDPPNAKRLSAPYRSVDVRPAPILPPRTRPRRPALTSTPMAPVSTWTSLTARCCRQPLTSPTADCCAVLPAASFPALPLVNGFSSVHGARRRSMDTPGASCCGLAPTRGRIPAARHLQGVERHRNVRRPSAQRGIRGFDHPRPLRRFAARHGTCGDGADPYGRPAADRPRLPRPHGLVELHPDRARAALVVVEDADERPGVGAFIGEVHASILRALGAPAYVTNGAVRDLQRVRAMGFQFFAPHVASSHVYAHIVDFGQSVTVGGLRRRFRRHRLRRPPRRPDRPAGTSPDAFPRRWTGCRRQSAVSSSCARRPTFPSIVCVRS